MKDLTSALIQFRNYIETISDFSDQSWNLLQPALTTLALKRGAMLLSEGEKCNSIFFIAKGCCRAYYNRDGIEINTGFFFDNDFTANVKSLVTGQASEYFIRACEPVLIIQLDREKLLAAYEDATEIERFGRKILERLLARQEEGSDQFRLFTAQERYEYIQAHQPEILQRVSLTQLSSYIGISRETLSRIRRRKAMR